MSRLGKETIQKELLTPNTPTPNLILNLVTIRASRFTSPLFLPLLFCDYRNER